MPPTAAKLLPYLGQAARFVRPAGLAGINLYAAPRIETSRVPMQWSLPGEPASFAGKGPGLWLPLAVALLVTASLFLKARQSEAPSGIWDWIVLIASSCLLLGINAWHISAVMAWAARQS
ncbi:hypothetical protein [Methylobacterium radiodurans]|uniref:DUF1648 domain-containing protein n=1 Tax=Methylobacterium radiodurans TaxID=2202828 RepID=A0A2U8VUZ4_9HYPH|nr:hypothetical protein [Methylobacterium radiodurans]AWN37604.1 hypothetical protein DK427_19280 [Methylobacterium radiodurans]